jgi:hypothetical protein
MKTKNGTQVPDGPDVVQFVLDWAQLNLTMEEGTTLASFREAASSYHAYLLIDIQDEASIVTYETIAVLETILGA